MFGDEIPHIFLFTPPSYDAVALSLGPCVKLLRYEKLATSSTRHTVIHRVSHHRYSNEGLPVSQGNSARRGSSKQSFPESIQAHQKYAVEYERVQWEGLKNVEEA
jgi:hypothetical protein